MLKEDDYGRRVSIHAPREGCDHYLHESYPYVAGFNSRTPGGVRHRVGRSLTKATKFQFTHPGRGATYEHLCLREYQPCFNSRTPGGVRPLELKLMQANVEFQFTHPGRGATSAGVPNPDYDPVSIHAPREGCDLPWQGDQILLSRFNSRTPGGVRRLRKKVYTFVVWFQFTHPGRGATSVLKISLSVIMCFNSRTPGGVRLLSSEVSQAEKEFQFTHPGRGATHQHQRGSSAPEFQFTHPGRGATATSPCLYIRATVSIHAPREGCDTSVLLGYAPRYAVSIHAPREGCDC